MTNTLTTNLQSTSINKELQRIMHNRNASSFFSLSATIHTTNKNIAPLRIMHMDIDSDFVNNVCDYTRIKMVLPAGDFYRYVYLDANNLQITLYRRALNLNQQPVTSSEAITTQTYKAVFDLDSYHLPVDPTQINRLTTLDLNNIPPVNVEFQLLDFAEEALRIVMAGGAFSNNTYEDIIYSTLIQKSFNTKISGKSAINTATITKPDNVKQYPNIVIPHMTPIIDIPMYLQNTLHGVYNAGLGNYLKTYNSNKGWFVYPIYKTDYKKSNNKLEIYAVPESVTTGIDKTYIQDPSVLYLIANGKKGSNLSGTNKIMDKGVGFRMAAADSYMKKPVYMTNNGPVGVSQYLNTEVANQSMPNGANFAPLTKNPVSANSFKEYSKILYRRSSYLTITWHRSDPSLIFPGMPARYNFLVGNSLKYYDCTVIHIQTFIEPSQANVTNKSFISTSVLTLVFQS